MNNSEETKVKEIYSCDAKASIIIKQDSLVMDITISEISEDNSEIVNVVVKTPAIGIIYKDPAIKVKDLGPYIRFSILPENGLRQKSYSLKLQLPEKGLSYINFIESRNCFTNDYSIIKRLQEEAALKKGFSIEVLGKLDNGDPILLFSRSGRVSAPNLLISGGFHGEEPAGPWGILGFLETVTTELLDKVNLSILPLVNPTGFRRGQRNNDWGENPNRNFDDYKSGKTKPSREGHILLNHLERLKNAARNGFLTVHEDCTENSFYLYSYEHLEAPSDFTYTLRNEEAMFFESLPDGEIYKDPIKDGIVFNKFDSSFEAMLFQQEGIPLAMCTETPGRRDINRRVEAKRSVIFAFLNYFISLANLENTK